MGEGGMGRTTIVVVVAALRVAMAEYANCNTPNVISTTIYHRWGATDRPKLFRPLRRCARFCVGEKGEE